MPPSTGKTAFKNQQESGPPILTYRGCRYGLALTDGTFFSMNQVLYSSPQCSLGFGSAEKCIWLQDFCLPRAHTWHAFTVCLLNIRICFTLKKKFNLGLREAWELFSPILSSKFSASEDEESNLIQWACLPYSAQAYLAGPFNCGF